MDGMEIIDAACIEAWQSIKEGDDPPENDGDEDWDEWAYFHDGFVAGYKEGFLSADRQN